MVVVTAAAMLLIVMMVVMMLVVVVTAAAMLLIVMMVVMLQLLQLLFQSRLALHSLQQLGSSELIPRSGHQCSLTVVLPQQCYGCVQLTLSNGIGAGQNNGTGSFNLIIVEFTKILHIDLHLASICHSNRKAQHHIVRGNLLHSRHNIGQLAYTGGFDNHPIRMELFDNLLQCLAKIAHQATANATGIHLGNIDAGILQKAAVNADFTKLVFNQHQFLTGVSLLNHLFNQGRLSGTQKATVNINFCHGKAPSNQDFLLIIPQLHPGDKDVFPIYLQNPA